MPLRKVVIIGGGTAGLTIASRLQDHFEVTVLEKSEYSYKDYPLYFKIPLLMGLVFRNPNTNFLKKKKFLLDGREIPFWESNILGGASVINGCVHAVGNESSWNPVLKKFQFEYRDLIKHYSTLYSTEFSSKNKILLMQSMQNLIDYSFIDSLGSTGIPYGELDFSNEIKCGRIWNTVNKYLRSSVLDLIDEKKINISIGEKVKQIELDNRGAVSLIKTEKKTYKADYFILSSGTLGSNELLLNPLKEDSMLNKSIGKGVQDHTNLRVNAFTNKKTGSLNEIYYSSLKKTVLGAKHLLGQPTLMRGTGATSAVQLDLNRDGMIDTRIHIVQYIDTGRHDIKEYFSEKSGFSLSITPIFPESRGEITINNGALCVNPGYLSSSEDKKILKSALDFCIKILKTSPLSNHVSEIENEGLILDSPDDFVSNNYYSGAHLIGGLHDAVDSSFNFKGLENLFVCDASVLPCFPSSNIHSSIVLLSSIFSEKFISKYS